MKQDFIYCLIDHNTCHLHRNAPIDILKNPILLQIMSSVSRTKLYTEGKFTSAVTIKRKVLISTGDHTPTVHTVNYVYCLKAIWLAPLAGL